ncbi:MAG TPA: LytTR family DNA-binding domain-containing protein [Armatimonadota bacterium]
MTKLIRTAIADDEPASQRLLQMALEATGRVEIVGVASSGVECLRLWEELSPDVLFLDIKMGEFGGLEVASLVLAAKRPPAIVFITSHDDFALRAFELRAVDYVVKSPDLKSFHERIAETVARLEDQRRSPAPTESVRAVVDQLQEREPFPPTRKLPVKDYRQGTVRLIDPTAILYVERKERRAIIHAFGEDFPTYFTVAQLEERLAPAGFFRINPGTIINLDAVQHLIPQGDGSYDVLLKDAATGSTRVFTVSRNRARDLFAGLGL